MASADKDGSDRTADTSPEQLAELMVGRKVLLNVPKGPANPGRTILEVENLRVVARGNELFLRASRVSATASWRLMMQAVSRAVGQYHDSQLH